MKMNWTIKDELIVLAQTIGLFVWTIAMIGGLVFAIAAPLVLAPAFIN